jgi:hypothetical protein
MIKLKMMMMAVVMMVMVGKIKIEIIFALQILTSISTQKCFSLFAFQHRLMCKKIT